MQFGNQCSFDWTVSSHYYCNEFISKRSYDVDRIIGLRGTWSVWMTATRRPHPSLIHGGSERKSLRFTLRAGAPFLIPERKWEWSGGDPGEKLSLCNFYVFLNIAQSLRTPLTVSSQTSLSTCKYTSGPHEVKWTLAKLNKDYIFTFKFSRNSRMTRPTTISTTAHTIAFRTGNGSILLGMYSQKILPTLSPYIFKRFYFNSSLSLTRVVDK